MIRVDAKLLPALPIALVLGLALAGCGSDTVRATPEGAVNPELVTADFVAAAADVFGPSADPTRVLGRAGDAQITAGEVAVYLSLYPTLTTLQAVEDLIDIHAGSTMDEAASAIDFIDAAQRGRAISWMRRNIWENPEVSTPDPELVEELLTDPAHTTLFGTPELATVTHYLLTAQGEDQTDERGRNAEILAQRVKDELRGLDRTIFGADLLRAASLTIPPDDPLLDGMELYSDRALTFPREYAGAPRWVGLESVVPTFAEAAFTTPIGQVVGPVLSDYGWHIIVVEERTPADLPPPDEMRRIAEERVQRDQRSRALQDAMALWMQTIPVLMYEDNVGLLALSAEERIRAEAEAQGDRFR